MKSYAEKLKNPRWQRKRLEILQRDDFTCRACSSTTNTLHVHHIRYFKGREPWEYKEFYLVTLCDDCHRAEEMEIKQPPRTQPRAIYAETVGIERHHSLIMNATDTPVPDMEDIKEFFAGLKGLLEDTSPNAADDLNQGKVKLKNGEFRAPKKLDHCERCERGETHPKSKCGRLNTP